MSKKNNGFDISDLDLSRDVGESAEYKKPETEVSASEWQKPDTDYKTEKIYSNSRSSEDLLNRASEAEARRSKSNYAAQRSANEILIKHRRNRQRGNIVRSIVLLLTIAALIFSVWFFLIRDDNYKNIWTLISDRTTTTEDIDSTDGNNSEGITTSTDDTPETTTSYETVEVTTDIDWVDRSSDAE